MERGCFYTSQCAQNTEYGNIPMAKRSMGVSYFYIRYVTI